MESKKIRRILFYIPVAAIVALIAISAPAFITLSDGMEVEDAKMDVSIEGLFVRLDASVSVRSNLAYRVSDLTIDVMLVDQENGSTIRLASSDPQDLEPGQVAEYKVSQRLFAPSLILIMYDIMSEEGATLHFDVDASFGYMSNMLRFDVSTRMDLSVAEEGENLSFTVMENTDERFCVNVEGLNKALCPDNIDAMIMGGDETIYIEVVDEGEVLNLIFSSHNSLSEAISTISSSDDAKVVYDGKDLGLTQSQIQSLLSVLRLARSIL